MPNQRTSRGALRQRPERQSILIGGLIEYVEDSGQEDPLLGRYSRAGVLFRSKPESRAA